MLQAPTRREMGAESLEELGIALGVEIVGGDGCKLNAILHVLSDDVTDLAGGVFVHC